MLLQFSLCITEKLLSSTVSLTAARGRGKSAAMGLAIGKAILIQKTSMCVPFHVIARTPGLGSMDKRLL